MPQNGCQFQSDENSSNIARAKGISVTKLLLYDSFRVVVIKVSL